MAAVHQASVTGLWGLLGGLSSVVPWLLSFASTAQVRREADTPTPVTERQSEFTLRWTYVVVAGTHVYLEVWAYVGYGYFCGECGSTIHVLYACPWLLYDLLRYFSAICREQGNCHRCRVYCMYCMVWIRGGSVVALSSLCLVRIQLTCIRHCF